MAEVGVLDLLVDVIGFPPLFGVVPAEGHGLPGQMAPGAEGHQAGEELDVMPGGLPRGVPTRRAKGIGPDEGA